MRINKDGFDDGKLKDLIKTLKTNKVQIKVGVLGKGDSRQGFSSNASIGLVHEFGSPGANIPERSFLRIPLMNEMFSMIENSGLFKKSINEIIDSSGIKSFATKISVIAEKTVREAFNTGGFGKWKPSNMDRKKVHQTLVETQQLRNSITSEVIVED